jgi:hypothetical protein
MKQLQHLKAFLHFYTRINDYQLKVAKHLTWLRYRNNVRL